MSVRDVIAKARWKATRGDYSHFGPFRQPVTVKTSFAVGEDIADAVLSALDGAGFSVVPKEPTHAMEDAFLALSYNDEGPQLEVSAEDAWKTMLAASQEKPE